MDSAQRIKFTNKLLSLVKSPEHTNIVRELFCDLAVAKVPSPEPTPTEKSKSKVREFVESPILWGLFGVVGGVVATQVLSRNAFANYFIAFTFLGFWMAVCGVFLLLKVASGRWRKQINWGFSIAMLVFTYIGWRFVPKTETQPDVAATVMGQLKKNTPWIFEKPAAPAATTPFPPSKPYTKKLVPSLDLNYDLVHHALIFTNRGTTNVYFWGARYDPTGNFEGKPHVDPPVTLNANGGIYHVDDAGLEANLWKTDLGKSINISIPCRVFITMDDGIKRYIEYRFWVTRSGEQLEIETQELRVVEQDFTRQ